MASTPVHVLAPSGLTLTLYLYPEGSDVIANGAGNALTEQTNRKGVYLATVTQAISGRHYAIVKDGSGNLIANGALALTDTTVIHLVDDLVSLALVDAVANIDAAITAKGDETQGVIGDSQISVLAAISGTNAIANAIKAKTDQLQFTANLVQVVLHDATAAGLAKFVTVDTGELAAAAGSVALLAQGAGGGGGGLTGPNVVTITVVNDDDSTPIESAVVRLYRSGESETQLSDVSGQAVFTAASATFNVAISATGFAGLAASLTVAADGSVEYRLTPSGLVTPPPAPGLCNVLVKVINQHGSPIVGAIVSARIHKKAEFASASLVSNTSDSETTDASGEATLVLIRQDAFNTAGYQYKITVENGSERHTFSYAVPAADNAVAYLTV